MTTKTFKFSSRTDPLPKLDEGWRWIEIPRDAKESPEYPPHNGPRYWAPAYGCWVADAFKYVAIPQGSMA